MHFNFHFNVTQILWALAFAGNLVLLVVLLGRERARRFLWFTVATALVALRLLSSEMLRNRLPALTMAEIFIPLAVISAVVSLLVLVELTRHAFGRGKVQRRTLLVWAVGLVLIAGGVAMSWGPHPSSWKSIEPTSLLATMRLLQLVTGELSLMLGVLTIGLGALIVMFGHRFAAGWRSHTQRIVIGLAVVSISQLGVQAIWQWIARHSTLHSMAAYKHVLELRERLLNVNSGVLVAVLVWWIVCLWLDEPGAKLKKDGEPEPATE